MVGLNEYAKRRARQLAELGYIAMAVDMYGNGRMGNNPAEAQSLAMPFYQNPQMAKAHFDAALNKLKTFAQADDKKIAGIGYCFGGGVLLNIKINCLHRSTGVEIRSDTSDGCHGIIRPVVDKRSGRKAISFVER